MHARANQPSSRKRLRVRVKSAPRYRTFVHVYPIGIRVSDREPMNRCSRRRRRLQAARLHGAASLKGGVARAYEAIACRGAARVARVAEHRAALQVSKGCRVTTVIQPN